MVRLNERQTRALKQCNKQYCQILQHATASAITKILQKEKNNEIELSDSDIEMLKVLIREIEDYFENDRHFIKNGNLEQLEVLSFSEDESMTDEFIKKIMFWSNFVLTKVHSLKSVREK